MASHVCHLFWVYVEAKQPWMRAAVMMQEMLLLFMENSNICHLSFDSLYRDKSIHISHASLAYLVYAIHGLITDPHFLLHYQSHILPTSYFHLFHQSGTLGRIFKISLSLVGN